MFKSGFIKLDLLAVIHVLSTEERLFPGYALGRRSDGELSIFFARELPVRSMQAHHHVLVIYESRAHLLIAILVQGYAQHNTFSSGGRHGRKQEPQRYDDHFPFFSLSLSLSLSLSFSTLLPISFGIPKVPPSLLKPSISIGRGM